MHQLHMMRLSKMTAVNAVMKGQKTETQRLMMETQGPMRETHGQMSQMQQKSPILRTLRQSRHAKCGQDSPSKWNSF